MTNKKSYCIVNFKSIRINIYNFGYTTMQVYSIFAQSMTFLSIQLPVQKKI